MSTKRFVTIKKLGVIALMILLTAFAITGCQPSASDTNGDHEHENTSDHEHEDDHAHEDEHGSRVPNNGAVVRILTPANGATFTASDDIVVEIAVENFDLSAEGNHWHLYVDGKVLSMVAGGTTKTVVRSLEPGEHHIEVYLGLPTHEELEDGASITITVTK